MLTPVARYRVVCLASNTVYTLGVTLIVKLVGKRKLRMITEPVTHFKVIIRPYSAAVLTNLLFLTVHRSYNRYILILFLPVIAGTSRTHTVFFVNNGALIGI